ncbi:MAG: hypothetical protein ACLGIB_03395 [Actinomycetota bacterium]
MSEGLRWEQRRRVTESLSSDLPQMRDALEAGAQGPVFEEIHELLEGAEEGELIDWLTVAVYRHADGSIFTSIHGDPHRTTLQIKGLLHDAIWAAAHQE